MKYPREGYKFHGVYNMERISLAPIIEINETYWIKTGEEAIIEWEAFYNYRNKYPESGEYKITFEGDEIEADVINFERYWQPNKKSFNLGYLEDGYYSLTFTIEDESSHSNTYHVNLIISENPSEITKTNGFEIIGQGTFAVILLIITIQQVRRRRNKLVIKK